MTRAVRIGVYGMEEAPGFLAGELRAGGLDARELPDLAPKTLAGLDLLHVFYPPMAWRGFVTARLMGLATVAHWMGGAGLAGRRGRARLQRPRRRQFLRRARGGESGPQDARRAVPLLRSRTGPRRRAAQLGAPRSLRGHVAGLRRGS